MTLNRPSLIYRNSTGRNTDAGVDERERERERERYVGCEKKPISYMACNTLKMTFGLVRKVSSRISLRNPRRLIRDSTLRLH